MEIGIRLITAHRSENGSLVPFILDQMMRKRRKPAVLSCRELDIVVHLEDIALVHYFRDARIKGVLTESQIQFLHDLPCSLDDLSHDQVLASLLMTLPVLGLAFAAAVIG
jgi:hypothetical protein